MPVNNHPITQTTSSPYEIRSGEVQDIMTKMPHWIIRQGTTVLLSVMLILFGAAYFIRFPDIVTANVRISNGAVAVAELPVELAAKVKPGQKALIRLTRYPFHEFGKLEAVVDAVSTREGDMAYTARVRLVNGLNTTLHKTIPPEPQYFGMVEILTEDRTVWERVMAR
jgi:hypothetical protein